MEGPGARSTGGSNWPSTPVATGCSILAFAVRHSWVTLGIRSGVDDLRSNQIGLARYGGERQMVQSAERLARIREALVESGCDALLCTLPANVLLLSGYWPVVGSAVAVANRDGRVVVLAPDDE